MGAKTEIKMDYTPLMSELVEIKAAIWAFAEHQIPEGDQWQQFVSLSEKYAAKFWLEMTELRPQLFDDPKNVADKILRDYPDLKQKINLKD